VDVKVGRNWNGNEFDDEFDDNIDDNDDDVDCFDARE